MYFIKYIVVVIWVIPYLYLQGCVSVGDSLLVVTGEVEKHSGAELSCGVSIQLEDNELVFFNVSDRFSLDYTISPAKKSYRFELKCFDQSNGYKVYKSVVYQLGGVAENNVDLGIITIE